MLDRTRYDVLIIGGGHAGAEAAWAAANMLRDEFDDTAGRRGRVGLVTMDPAKMGAMSCNPAIGGLAKGQIVREVDALGGLMGLAADASGIQFRELNASKGPAVRGPRCQNDKYAYAREVQRLLATRENLFIIPGTVERFIIEDGRCKGIVYMPNPDYCREPWRERREGETLGDSCCTGEYFTGPHGVDPIIAPTRLNARAVVLTTGTFMRGLMHRGEQRTDGGRVGEKSAVGISDELRRLGFELGRLKTGTPPRLDAQTLDFNAFDLQPGDDEPRPFSEMTGVKPTNCNPWTSPAYERIAHRFPVLEQRPCWITHTNETIHELIRANLDHAPMYNGQIDTTGPRYCPSIEDKVVRFADKHSHHVFLEPESLETHEIYCNGISTSLPEDVQERIVHQLPGCERARILRFGYAVEYDMVVPNQIDATTMTKRYPGLLLAGQINGTTGYEEAAGQGVIAGVNAVLHARGESSDTLLRLGRDQAYIGVLMDDLVTRIPTEPYRMFTSRAEHRLVLRADNADERLTPLAHELGLIDDTRWHVYQQKQQALQALRECMQHHRIDGKPMRQWARGPHVAANDVLDALDASSPGASPRAPGVSSGVRSTPTAHTLPPRAHDRRVIERLLADLQYAGYIQRQQRQIEQMRQQEHTPLPTNLDYTQLTGLRAEAAQTLNQYRPATLGQAGRLAGVNPADLMIVSVALGKATS